MSPTTLQGMTSPVSRVVVLLYRDECLCAQSSLVYDTTVLTNLELCSRCSPYLLLALGYDDSAPAIMVQYVL